MRGAGLPSLSVPARASVGAASGLPRQRAHAPLLFLRACPLPFERRLNACPLPCPRPRPLPRAPAAQYRQRWNTDGTAIKTAQMAKVFGGLPATNFRASGLEDRAALYADWIYLRQVGARARTHALWLGSRIGG
jgi:hypothetical protein